VHGRLFIDDHKVPWYPTNSQSGQRLEAGAIPQPIFAFVLSGR
jgi:hypothetical protein